MPTEPELARAALTAIKAYEQLPRNSPRRASLQLHGGAVENCYDHGCTRGDLHELVESIWEEWKLRKQIDDLG